MISQARYRLTNSDGESRDVDDLDEWESYPFFVRVLEIATGRQGWLDWDYADYDNIVIIGVDWDR